MGYLSVRAVFKDLDQPAILWSCSSPDEAIAQADSYRARHADLSQITIDDFDRWTRTVFAPIADGLQQLFAIPIPRNVSKTVKVYILQGIYEGNKWEDLTGGPDLKEVRADRKDYRENDPRPYRIVTRRISRARFEAGDY